MTNKKPLILFLILFLTFNCAAQSTNWTMTCKQLPSDFDNVIIWYSNDRNETPNLWTVAFYNSEKHYYINLLNNQAILESQVSHWYSPSPPASYCSDGSGGDGGPLE